MSTPISGKGKLEKRRGANLPHWRRRLATYAVTFRLADSLPSRVLEEWRWERAEIFRRARDMGRGSNGAGEFWQKESYDHLVRDAEDLAHQVDYVLNNPAKAGLVGWAWVGRMEKLSG